MIQVASDQCFIASISLILNWITQANDLIAQHNIQNTRYKRNSPKYKYPKYKQNIQSTRYKRNSPKHKCPKHKQNIQNTRYKRNSPKHKYPKHKQTSRNQKLSLNAIHIKQIPVPVMHRPCRVVKSML